MAIKKASGNISISGKTIKKASGNLSARDGLAKRNSAKKSAVGKGTITSSSTGNVSATTRPISATSTVPSLPTKASPEAIANIRAGFEQRKARAEQRRTTTGKRKLKTPYGATATNPNARKVGTKPKKK